MYRKVALLGVVTLCKEKEGMRSNLGLETLQYVTPKAWERMVFVCVLTFHKFALVCRVQTSNVIEFCPKN